MSLHAAIEIVKFARSLPSGSFLATQTGNLCRGYPWGETSYNEGLQYALAHGWVEAVGIGHFRLMAAGWVAPSRSN
jgi:hypothetical protein